MSLRIPALILATTVAAAAGVVVATPAPPSVPLSSPSSSVASPESAAAEPRLPDPVAVPATGSAGGVVRVDGGWLRGRVGDGYVTYSAIPYAAAPVGERRWQPPARPRPWRGVRDATAPSPYCAQSGGPGVVGREDCLYLDVTVPGGADGGLGAGGGVDAGRAGMGGRRPVLVWLYGGGFVSGGAREYDGARLATAGDAVVVTVNYRLGALGFLAAPSLGAAGNYGLMDQQAALRWVRRNAARFGGDPGNVTLAGQSAGARADCAQLASPAARGLFDRAITQSGACDNPVPTAAEARAFGEQATAAAGCAAVADVAGCLRDLPPDRLVGLLSKVGTELGARVADRPWNPVAGTALLPRQPGDALRDGSAARVPLLIGGARDDMRAFVAGESVTAESYRALVTEMFGADAATVLAAYPLEDYESPAVALATLLGDWGGWVGACPVLRTAEAAAVRQPVYAYEFAEDSGVVDEGFPMGAFHGLDLPYLWDLDLPWNPYPPLTGEQERLSATMIDYWTAFARTGDPNGPGRPHWPEFGATGAVLGLSTGGIAPTPLAADHRCDLWAGLLR